VELKVSSQAQGDQVIVTALGEIDLYTAPRLQGELAAVLSADRRVQVVVDMSGVEFCDSTGMNVLLSAMKRAREHGGGLNLACPRPAVRKILQVTGLDSVFTVVDAAAFAEPVTASPAISPVTARPVAAADGAAAGSVAPGPGAGLQGGV
jgi:anti-sigma B factor antagonist